ncbi:ABC transporter ATP-binding protein [Ensifer sp. ENS05]|uniref:ABC transporter ATP-binding protein n=1 Tax=Ensifer sp. ENS05 TaxID=2769277 RepID=UPI00178409D7|nr:ABC transporter ATP-binding protein [Ensifer sp. ENS05]MBD9597363.1 ABC transporter ATP-binding protein [Ensifer sp. ENS05]
MTAILESTDLRISFGGVQAVRGVGLSLDEGELLGLIGPNGAGKTTLLRLLTGILRPDEGRILLKERDVTRLPIDRRARAGLAMTHQIVRPFRTMSTIENVMIAAGHKLTASPARAVLNVDRTAARAKAQSLLELVGLASVTEMKAGALPLGQLKRLEVARALALEPDVLLLDEPLAGLNHAEASMLSDVIAGLNKTGLTIILVEHRLAEVVRICSRLAVLDQGSLMATGSPTEVMARPDVQAAYLGGH